MIFNNREELNTYLNSFDFDSTGRTAYSNVYFLVRWDGHEEPLYFFDYMGAWFESDCELSCASIGECGLDVYLHELYEDVDEILISHEKDMCREGMHYEIISCQGIHTSTGRKVCCESVSSFHIQYKCWTTNGRR